MKINEVEKQLGITKANIRFYEKEGLITPVRNENGYRDYTEADIIQLKEIIILRKLGIPVQQIADIFDGTLPLQDALDSSIQTLQAEIEKLNGSLALCRQLKQEDARTLDTLRYWELIHDQEQLGFQFQSLVDDYLTFTEIGYQWMLWPLPSESLRKPWNVGIYICVLSALNAVLETYLYGNNFFVIFVQQVFTWIQGFAIWTAIFVPLFFLSKKKPKLADGIMSAFLILPPIVIVAMVIWLFASALSS